MSLELYIIIKLLCIFQTDWPVSSDTTAPNSNFKG